ncbi:MAG: hypothetical protein JWM85_547 [Acidimicrobiaceae bacterium]|nr:hypothetical protein [Acidimicrobiaceae bacterium]
MPQTHLASAGPRLVLGWLATDESKPRPAESEGAEMKPIYQYVPHHRTKEKLSGQGHPVATTDQLPRGTAAARFNTWLALKVTEGVGTMWCAYAFAGLALVSLPSAISSHSVVVLVSWVSQTFLQLVLLSVIIVGQNVLAAAADKRSEATYNDADAVLHEAVKIQEHLMAQDQVLQRLLAKLDPAGNG